MYISVGTASCTVLITNQEKCQYHGRNKNIYYLDITCFSRLVYHLQTNISLTEEIHSLQYH